MAALCIAAGMLLTAAPPFAGYTGTAGITASAADATTDVYNVIGLEPFEIEPIDGHTAKITGYNKRSVMKPLRAAQTSGRSAFPPQSGKSARKHSKAISIRGRTIIRKTSMAPMSG